jgi:hypothetical protein
MPETHLLAVGRRKMPDNLFGADRCECDAGQGWIASRLSGNQTITAEKEILHPQTRQVGSQTLDPSS